MKQTEAIEIIMGGHNVFLTGAAGSGKTWVLNECIEKLTKSGKDVAVTATTGIAATHIDGSTIHSWSRIMIRDESDLADDDVIEHIVENDKTARKNIRACDTLIIDEISMLHAYQLDAIDKICKGIRRSTKPFGGIQIILSGDFFQLPPVVKNGKKKCYAFESQTWTRSNIKVCYLEEQYRQLDKEFISILNEIRENSVSPTSKKLLDSRYLAKLENESTPLKLYPLNQDVDLINSSELAKINKPANTYIMNSFGDPNIVESLKKGCIAKEELSLKIGTPVIFIKNNRKEGYINGTQGVVIGFTEPDLDTEDFDEDNDEESDNGEYPIVKTIDGKIITASPESWKRMRHEKTEGLDEYGNKIMKVREITIAAVTQIPLILGWSMTVHKCVSGDTLIATKNGLRYIKDISLEYNVEDNTYKECNIPLWSNKEDAVANQIFNGGAVESLKITTESGFVLIGRCEHPILLRDKNGNEVWKTLSEVTVNDTAVMQKGFNICGSNEIKIDISTLKKGYRTVEYKIPKIITKELAWILGVLIGDGCITDKRDARIDITKNSIYIIETFSKYMHEIFDVRITIIKPKYRNCYVAYCHSWFVRNILDQLGLGFNVARNKQVPFCILTATTEIQKYFLQGLFDTDGGVSASCIHLTSCSRKLLQEAQMILLNLNIISSLRVLSVKNDAHRLQISGINARNFIKTINFSEPVKEAQGKKRYGIYRYATPKVQKGFFPDSKEVAKDIYELLLQTYGKPYGKIKRLHLPVKEITTFLTTVIRKKCGISCEHIIFLLDLFPDIFHESKYELFRTMFFEKIVSIEKTKEHVYDLHVPDTHYFIGNGFTNHNSQGMSLDCVEMDLSRVFEEGMGYVALSRVRTLAGIRLLGMNQIALRVNPKIIEVDNIFRSDSDKNKEELCSKVILDEKDKESDEHNFNIREASYVIFNDIYLYVALKHPTLLPNRTMEELNILYNKLMEDVDTIVCKINTNVEV